METMRNLSVVIGGVMWILVVLLPLLGFHMVGDSLGSSIAFAGLTIGLAIGLAIILCPTNDH